MLLKGVIISKKSLWKGKIRCQIGTLKRGQYAKYLPYAFTEQGVAMLSTVLNSKRAIYINIQIMRAFVRIRQYLATHKELARKVEELDKNVKLIFRTLHQLMNPPELPAVNEKPPIGFKP
jgi:hypothetical protein